MSALLPSDNKTSPCTAVPGLMSLAAAIRDCRRCQAAGYLAQPEPRLLGLAHLLSPARPSPVPRRPRLLVTGQAPGRHAGLYTEPFTSPYGRTIAQWLTRAGFVAEELPDRVHLTALTRCFPGAGPGGRGDRAPSRAEIALCAPFLQAEIAWLRPAVILPVGKLAIDTLYGRARPLSAVIGSTWERDGIRYLPVPHPSGVSHWRNDPAHRALVEVALAILASWRTELSL